MRTEEILKALSQKLPGIEVHSRPNSAFCRVLYVPHIACTGKTIFEAAFKVAQQLIIHCFCPQSVKEALEDYDLRSARLQQ